MKHFASLFINGLKKSNFLLFPFFLISIFFVIIPTIVIVHYAFFLKDGDSELFSKLLTKNTTAMIVRSLYIAFWVLALSILIAYPVAYFIFECKSKYVIATIVLLLSMPIWSNSFIKLIGLKSMLDYLHGFENSTYGFIYSIFALTYIYSPIAVLTIFNTLKNMPKNLLFASQDLGLNKFSTFFQIVLPYTKSTLIAVVMLIFLPAFFSIAPSAFLNNENGSKMIGEFIANLAINGLENNSAKSTTSFFVLMIVIIAILTYFFCKWLPKFCMFCHNNYIKRKNKKILEI